MPGFQTPLKVLLAALLPSLAVAAAAPTHVRFNTSLGKINVTLLPDSAPKTVTNFLAYANNGSYDESIFHRVQAGFVAQGGGYFFGASGAGTDDIEVIPTGPPVVNEFKVSNTRGTLAMAKVSGDPNSATDQWFFNLADNSGGTAALDTQNGGFTVFGQVSDAPSLAVMDAIGSTAVFNTGNDAFNSIPLINFQGNSIQHQNLLFVTSIDTILDAGTADFSISVSPSPLDVPSGGSSPAVVTVTPLNGYAGTVELRCGPLPTAATCGFSPATVTLTAGGGAQTSNLSVSATTAHAALMPGGPGSWRSLGWGGGAAPGMLAGFFGLACVAAAAFFFRARRPVRLGLALSGGLLIAAGCSGSNQATVSGAYTFTVRGSDGTISHPFDLAINIQ